MNFKPGDMAMIVRVPSEQERVNLGAILTLKPVDPQYCEGESVWGFVANRPVLCFDETDPYDLGDWVIDSDCDGEDFYCFVHSWQLMPLRGDAQDEAESTNTPIPAEVV